MSSTMYLEREEIREREQRGAFIGALMVSSLFEDEESTKIYRRASL